MILLMNSSKTLDFDPSHAVLSRTIPEFIKDAEMLVKELRRLSESEEIKSFNVEGYQLNPKLSSELEWVFTRSESGSN